MKPFILFMIIALAPVARGSRTPPFAFEPQQPMTPPGVSPEFQPEISQLAATGLKLKEAVEASLDGSAHHLAAIFQREKPKAPRSEERRVGKECRL